MPTRKKTEPVLTGWQGVYGQEPYTPKYSPEIKKQKNIAVSIVKIVFVGALFIFVLGFMSMFEHANNGMKGRH